METASIHLIIGGISSGKSAYALACAQLGRAPYYYVATAEALDDEMGDKIALHQFARNADWITIEQPLDLAGELQKATPGQIIVIDCIQSWLGNLFHHQCDIDRTIDETINALGSCLGDVIIVSAETGFGLLGMDAPTRKFQRVLGETNQRISRISKRTTLIVAGNPIDIKP